MSDSPETRSDRNLPMAPWMRGLIAIAVMLGLGTFSLVGASPPSTPPELAGTITPIFRPQQVAGTRTPTPIRVLTPTRFPTRLPDGGSNKNGDMCTVIASEHAERPDVPLCNN